MPPGDFVRDFRKYINLLSGNYKIRLEVFSEEK
jgi:hypothetical protein